MNGKLENSVGQIENEWGDKLTIYENGIHLKTSGFKFFDTRGNSMAVDREIPYESIEDIVAGRGLFSSILRFEIKGDNIWDGSQTFIKFKGRKKSGIIKKQIEEIQKYDYPNYLKKKAAIFEDNLDYDSAIKIWEQLGETKESKRIRKLVAEQGTVKMDQTVVHGDYVDGSETTTTYIDKRDTIVKDSVINRSNVGAGEDDKLTKIKELKELLDSSAIDDDEFKQMKKEILGK